MKRRMLYILNEGQEFSLCFLNEEVQTWDNMQQVRIANGKVKHKGNREKNGFVSFLQNLFFLDVKWHFAAGFF